MRRAAFALLATALLSPLPAAAKAELGRADDDRLVLSWTGATVGEVFDALASATGSRMVLSATLRDQPLPNGSRSGRTAERLAEAVLRDANYATARADGTTRILVLGLHDAAWSLEAPVESGTSAPAADPAPMVSADIQSMITQAAKAARGRTEAQLQVLTGQAQP